MWQPTGGQVDGALEFDGMDDTVIAGPILDPAEGPFSVLAWVRGGTAGQAIISEPGGVNWLSLDLLAGHLMTELSRRSAVPLLSETTITDGQWHRIALVWDGSYRHLHVDGIEVAMDATPLSELESAEGGLYFGTGSDLTAGTFFSGLIDDIRIYNRAIHP